MFTAMPSLVTQRAYYAADVAEMVLASPTDVLGVLATDSGFEIETTQI